MSDIVERLRHFTLFLRGHGAINGAWFGDNADGERGKFWWRKYLPLTEAADEIQSLRQRVERLEGALRDIVDRSHNDPLGTSKVIDMRKLAVAALSPKVQEGE